MPSFISPGELSRISNKMDLSLSWFSTKVMSLLRTPRDGTMRKVKTEPTIRHTARVLLVDELGRVLLFQGHDLANPSDIYWCPVGGGIQLGESPEDAARREVREETGLINFDLGPHVWNRQDKYLFNGENYHVSETWFFSRVSAFEIDTTSLFGVERTAFLGYRWWTQSELDVTTEIMTPRQLAPLLKDLILNGVPGAPLEFGMEKS